MNGTGTILGTLLAAAPSALWGTGPAAAQVLPDTPVAHPRPLRYVASNEGLDFPRWEGGRSEMEMVDVNDDGHIDLVSIGDHGSPYINADEHGVMVYFGDGRGSWAVQMRGDFGYGGVAVGDIDGDGLQDVAYGMHHDYSGDDFGDQLIEAALGDGSGVDWTPWDDGLATNGETWGMFGTDLGDIDGDGDLDLVSISFGGGAGLHVYRNNGDGTWTQSYGFLGGNSQMDVVLGEVDGDGILDICASHQYGTIYLGDGSGGFVDGDGNLPPATLLGRDGPDLGDVDGDGRDDISWATNGGGLQVWLARGVGLWLDASRGLPASGRYDGTQLHDMDGDGRAELVAQTKGAVTVFDAGSGGWFEVTSMETVAPGYHSALRAGGDVDHNGMPDLVAIASKGGWLHERNQVLVFKELRRATAVAIRFEEPLAGRVLRGGAVSFVDYVATIPEAAIDDARVDLDYSLEGPTGPWLALRAEAAPGGRVQIVMPVEAAGDSIHFRLTLDSSAGFATVVSAGNEVR